MTFVTRFAAALVALALAGCGGSGGGGPSAPARTAAAPAGVTPSQRDEFERGRQVAMQTGCFACHRIGKLGNDEPGPDLSRVRDRLPASEIARVLRDPTAPMPSYKSLPPADLDALVFYLSRVAGRP